MKKIIIKNAHEHNLKSIDLEIPHHCLTVVTGVSGSGKSSLVFDTIFREAERRYLESFSAYARRFLAKLGRPAVNHISGLSPCIAVDQKSAVRTPRSTVGTKTELYDYLRLLFARLGKPGKYREKVKLERRLFSFNSPYGACPGCKGLGVQDRVDPQLLIADPEKSLSQGALIITTPKGYIVYSQVTMEVLDQVCRAHGFNVDIPWNRLTEEQQGIVLYGSDKIKIPYGKHPLESRLKWSGITAKPREEGYYKGIIPVIENILKVKRNKNILRFARSKTCADCGGARLNETALSVTFREQHIAAYAAKSIAELDDFFTGLGFSQSEAPVGEPIRREFLRRSALLKKLGLDHLTLDRESTTLSSGEARRINLCTQVGSGLRGILYILDEPSIGLHHRDMARLLEMLRYLRDSGNTVIVVEHDEETMRCADRLIDLGPGAGGAGGEILFNGPTEELFIPAHMSNMSHKSYSSDNLPPGKSRAEAASGLPDASTSVPSVAKNLPVEKSRTAAFLRGEERIDIPAQRRAGSGQFLKVTGAAVHNLKNISVSFKLGALNVVTGVSGAGKSTLVHHVLARGLTEGTKQKFLQGGPGGAIFLKSAPPGRRRQEIFGSELINKIIEIDQAPIGRTPRSNPATYTKLFDFIRDLFAGLPESRRRGWDKGRFSFNVKGGRCDNCEGAGLEQIGMHFLGDVEITCPECGGRRFNEETLQVEYKGKNIYDVLEMQVDEACDFFKEHKKISRCLRILADLGLGYIALGQSSTTLSGGEAQRIKLAAELCRPAVGHTLYILDEPTSGLHAADIKILLDCLNSLIDKGNTVITAAHHPGFIKTADWIIDLGPESGDRGGELVACGTPEEVARNEKSFTGAFLKKILDPAVRAPYEGTPGEKKPPLIPSPRGGAIRLRGVRTHNLKNINVEIPMEKLTVVTGVSGSGKSSLAFDTLFTAGQQAFLSGFSTYARRLLVNKEQADMESCSGLTPTIAINRSGAARNPRSTVGTMTEIYDFYRLLFARAGRAHCPRCGRELESGSCAQCSFTGEKTLFARMFSFNHHQGACARCKGLGVITVCDPRKLVTHPQRSLLSGALDGSKTGRFYGDPFGRHAAILRQVGKEAGLDFSLAWAELSEAARQIAMYGTGEKEYRVAWKFKRKNREGEHEFTTGWSGFVNYVNKEYERKHDDKRGDAMLPLMKEETCPQCRGRRLKEEFLSVYFAGIDITDLSGKTVKESFDFFKNLGQDDPGKGEPIRDVRAADKRFANQKFFGGNFPQSTVENWDRRTASSASGAVFQKSPPCREAAHRVGAPHPRELEISPHLRQEILKRLSFLQDMGLDYLTLDRRASSLSGGEAQRIRLAGLLGSGLTGVTYVLDEPTIGLHSRDTRRLTALLHTLRDVGNTVVVVEHDADIMRAADHIIDLGPGPGKHGGKIIARGTAAEIVQNPASLTGKYLRSPRQIPVPTERRSLHPGINITGACANNLAGFDIEIPRGGVIVLTGVSGSGKSTLLFQVLAASAAAGFPVGCGGISGLEHFYSIVTVDQQGIGAASTSTPVTYTGLFDYIRDLFARSETAHARGYKKNRFSFNVKGGRCETCRGTGEIRISMDFLTDVRTSCPDCKGKRYNNDTLACSYKNKNIAEVLNLTAVEALDFFAGEKVIGVILEQLAAVGLGYLQLGQPADTLSSGEAQRLKLASELLKGPRRPTTWAGYKPLRGGKASPAAKPHRNSTAEAGETESCSPTKIQAGNLYLFDEPSTGLHFEDVSRLLDLFNRLVEAGNTIVVIEHHPDIIKSADWIIDLGPEGGDRGGRVLGSGTPEHIATLPHSPTGRLLASGGQKPF